MDNEEIDEHVIGELLLETSQVVGNRTDLVQSTNRVPKRTFAHLDERTVGVVAISFYARATFERDVSCSRMQ